MHRRALGWSSFFQDHWHACARLDQIPARVAEEHRGAYRLVSEAGEFTAEITGAMRRTAADSSAFPAVGDWVAMETIAGERKGLIHAVLPRRTKLSRKATGDRSRPEHMQAAEQILAANIDTVLIVMALNVKVSGRLLERFLGAVRAGGAEPVLVLNKADLCPDLENAAAPIAASAAGIRSYALSAATGAGIEQLQRHTGCGKTVVLVGASGVGKSSIINRLFDSDLQTTSAIRGQDGRGRHTTTYRRMFFMPAGGILIDTPGIRELHLWDGDGIADTFEEIERLAAACRFRDCRHDREPGCAVRQAVESGMLNPERLDNHARLQRELQHLDRRRDPTARSEERRRWKPIRKALRQHYTEKYGKE